MENKEVKPTRGSKILMMLSSKQDRERLLSQQDRQRIEFMESCPKHESTNGTTRHEISKALKDWDKTAAEMLHLFQLTPAAKNNYDKHGLKTLTGTLLDNVEVEEPMMTLSNNAPVQIEVAYTQDCEDMLSSNQATVLYTMEEPLVTTWNNTPVRVEVADIQDYNEMLSSNQVILFDTLEEPVMTLLNAPTQVENANIHEYEMLSSNQESSSAGPSGSVLEENLLLKERIRKLEEQLSSTTGNDLSANEMSEAGPSTQEKSNRSQHYKQYFCIFCQKLVDHFSRHLINKHKSEDEIILLASLKKNSKERSQLLAKIRGRGSLIYNTNYDLNKGNLIIARRRPEETNEKTLKPCINCHNYYKKTTLWRHYKICSGKPSAPRDLQQKSEIIAMKSVGDDSNLNSIFPGMEKDEVYDIVISDEAILEYGNYLCMKNIEHHLKNMIRTKLRQVAKLTLEMKKINPEIKNLDDSLRPEHFDTFLNAARAVAGFHENLFKSPSLVGEIGRSLKIVASRRIIYYIKTNNDMRKSEIEKWLHIYNHDYYNTIGRHALRQMQKKKWGKTQLVPLTEDVIKLNNYLNDKITESVNTLEEGFNLEAFHYLNKCLMAQIQIFNRKRAGEIEKFEISDFNKRHNIQKESLFYKTLKPSEKIVASKYMRVETRGKLYLKPASMLLTLKQIEHINFILQKREEAGVDKSNPYVFARKQTIYGAYTALREAAYASDAVHPDLLVGTLLRKQIATTAQALNFTENDLGNLASFLGHNINTHRNFYRLPSEAVHLAKISRLLMAMDDGTIDNFHGKSLDEINVNLNVDEFIEETPVQELNVNEDEVGLECEELENAPGPSSQLKQNRSRSPQMRTPIKSKRSEKHSWTTPERQTVRRVFNKYLSPTKKNLPTPIEVREAIKKNKQLKGLSINQVKGWVFSERKRLLRK